MTINTQLAWWSMASGTIPYLKKYAEHFRCSFDTDQAMIYMAKKDHQSLHTMFQKLWNDLPDSHSIRIPPFYSLCDLCSEYWVFHEDDK